MKTIKTLFAAALAAFSLSSCGGFGTMGGQTGSAGNGSILGSVLGAVTNGDALGNILGSVLGMDRMTEQQIAGSWSYRQPGVAFTSEKLLAQAGGEVVASQIKEKLGTYYKSLGVSSSNTYFTFNTDHSFSGKLLSTPISGTWSYNAQTYQINMKTMLFTLSPYVKRTTAGMSMTLESKKLLTALQTIAAVSGNNTLQGIGQISTNFDGVRLGFDMGR
ncbi:MAG: DUF4923 family protein [Bacteroidaceae bacterium]|nr:DUF4923 family protein [Bacteroidaceae bacterium]